MHWVTWTQGNKPLLWEFMFIRVLVTLCLLFLVAVGIWGFNFFLLFLFVSLSLGFPRNFFLESKLCSISDVILLLYRSLVDVIRCGEGEVFYKQMILSRLFSRHVLWACDHHKRFSAFFFFFSFLCEIGRLKQAELEDISSSILSR